MKTNNNTEVWTPRHIMDKMIAQIPDESYRGPVLEPSAGIGDFVLAIIDKKISIGMTKKEAIDSTFAVEIKKYNCDILKKRVYEKYGIEFRNILCCDFLKNIDKVKDFICKD